MKKFKFVGVLLLVFGFSIMPVLATVVTPPTANVNVSNTSTSLLSDLIARIEKLEARVAQLERMIAPSTLPGQVPKINPKAPDMPITTGGGVNTSVMAPNCKQIDGNNWICQNEQGQTKMITKDGVAAIQTLLKAEGSFTYPTATGYYGDNTRAAVQMFQAKNQLKITGVIDQATLEKMKAVAGQVAPALQTSIQAVAQ